VTFWWGDERFLPAGDPERNETQAREAFGELIEHLQDMPEVRDWSLGDWAEEA
jgi:6-phosphogluconolactonase